MSKIGLPGTVIGLLWIAAILAVSPAFAYTLQYASSGDVVRWDESCFRYSIHKNGAPGIDSDTLHQAIRASFNAWEDVDCSYFYFEETDDASCDDIGYVEKTGNINLFVFRDTDWAIDADHSAAAIALTTTSWDDNSGRLLDADIEFNAEYFTFETDGSLGTADIRNTATHEIGHMLGLDHSNVQGSTMQPTSGVGDINKRTLASDDIEGLCELYPQEEDPDVCDDPHCGLDLSCSSTTCDKSGIAYPASQSSSSCTVAGPLGSTNTSSLFRAAVTLLTGSR